MPVASFSLEGKLALVTGAASGIGIGIAQTLAEAGAHVVIADRDDVGAAKAADDLKAAGLSSSTVHLDLACEKSIVAACAEVIGQHGAPWVLVNNAGVQDRELIVEGTADHWDQTNAINARGPYLMTREIARAMIAKGEGGRIINVATCAVRGLVIKGLTAYAGSKGALVGLSHMSAFELAEHAITVNVVMPGGVYTPGSARAKGPPSEGPARRRPPLAQLCEPSDIASAVYYFATPAARYVTNQIVAVDAGFSIS